MTASIEKDNESFAIADPMSGAIIRFNYPGGVEMTGSHELPASSLPTSIERSSVTARKLSDNNLAIGHLDMSYVDDGRNENVSFAPVECLTQAYGDMRVRDGSETDTEITNFVASKGSQHSVINLIDRDSDDNFFAHIYTPDYSQNSGIIIARSPEPNDVLITNNNAERVEIDAMFFDILTIDNDITLSVLMGF